MATHYFVSHHGGVEVVADRLFRGLTERGFEVVWTAGDSTAVPDRIGDSRAIGLRVFNYVEEKTGLPFPIPSPAAFLKLRNEIKSVKVVVLHDCLYLANIAAFLFAKLRHTPVVIIQHVGIIPYRNSALRLLMKFANAMLTRPMLSRADQVVFISEETKKYFSSLQFRNSPELVLNGVDTDLYRTLEPEESRADLRSQFDLPADRPAILYVGRFIENKGLSILRKMAGERQDWLWVFAGRPGPLNPKDWNAPNVRVFCDLPDAALAALYRACDLFVLPSRYEAFSLVVREALSSGLPVICTLDVSKSDPAITPYIQGISIYSGDDERTVREFLSAIDAIMNSGFQGRSTELREFAISRYSLHRSADRYSEILSHLASSVKGAAPVIS